MNGSYASVGGTVVLNTLLNAGGPLSNQFTDRLLINGSAGGITSVQVNGSGAGAATNTTGVARPTGRVFPSCKWPARPHPRRSSSRMAS